MTINPQFLFFYIDELVKNYWVDWLEGPLSRVPAPGQRGRGGFQQVLGDVSAGPRTRAGEAYRVGLLSGRVVQQRSAGALFPSGWRTVVDGKIPATKLGRCAYVVGRALRTRPDEPGLMRFLDYIASICILHIAFRCNGRWYSSALLFKYVYDQLALSLGRELTDQEIRCLAGAVFNTLSSNRRMLILSAYESDRPIENLIFDTEGNIVPFALQDLPGMVADRRVGVNSFRNVKAALFWAEPARGIYARATRSVEQRSFLQELLRSDIALASAGGRHLLSKVYAGISGNRPDVDIFTNARDAFSGFPGLMQAWRHMEFEVLSTTDMESPLLEMPDLPNDWTFPTQAGKDDASAPKVDEKAPASGKRDGTPPRVKIEHSFVESNAMTTDDMREYIAESISAIESAPPEKKPEAALAVSVRPPPVSTMLYEKNLESRALGDLGERFVLEYERQRLSAAGREDLAARVSWASKEIGDGLGYDIKSFTVDGRDILIEVKTTTGRKDVPFFVTENELAVSEDKALAYRLYRVFDFLEEPRLFILSGSMRESLELEAIAYRARTP